LLPDRHCLDLTGLFGRHDLYPRPGVFKEEAFLKKRPLFLAANERYGVLPGSVQASCSVRKWKMGGGGGRRGTGLRGPTGEACARKSVSALPLRRTLCDLIGMSVRDALKGQRKRRTASTLQRHKQDQELDTAVGSRKRSKLKTEEGSPGGGERELAPESL